MHFEFESASNNGHVDWEGFFKDLDSQLNDSQKKELDKNKRAFLDDREHQKVIEKGLVVLRNMQIVALKVPSDITEIENFEQIFQRLNGQGTPLDSEELVYSMIKAYWPDVESIFENSKCVVTTEARLIGMAVRVALTNKDAKKIIEERSVQQIRSIFKHHSDRNNCNNDAGERNEQSGQETDEDKVKNYVKNKLTPALEWIDNILLRSDERPYGIPAYLRSSIAWNSRDVFLWLMYLANKFDNAMNNIDDDIRKRIIGIALIIHWFGVNKNKAIAQLVEKLSEGDDLVNALRTIQITDFDGGGKNEDFVYRPLNLGELEELIPEVKCENDLTLQKKWNFWNFIDERGKVGYWIRFSKIINEKELLVYRQRDYIDKKFKGFDPSNRSMWKGHNRPWDYDHILPSNSLNGQRSGGIRTFTWACQAWQKSIGNLVAVDFAFNRKSQAVEAQVKYNNSDSDKLNGELMNIASFNIDLGHTDDFEKSKEFINAVRERFLKIYDHWYHTLNVGSLCDSPPKQLP